MSPTESADAVQRVVIVARPAEGGIRSHLVLLLRYCDRSHFSFTLAAPASLLESLVVENLPAFDQLELPIAARFSLADLACARRLTAFAAGSRVVVHAHGIRAGMVASLAKMLGARFPLIVTFHNVPPLSRLGRAALRLIGSRAAAQIAVSRAIAARLMRNPVPSVIPNGIELDKFKGSTGFTALGRPFDSDSPQVTVGAVARLSPEKGIDVLLEAGRLTPDLRYIVAGTGSEEAKLKATAPANVAFLGYVAETRAVYAVSDLIAIPSRSEGQGIVALEAMASGTPVVASNVGGLAETIDDGVTGILVAPENPEALAKAILSLSANPELRQFLAAAARAWVNDHADVRRRVAEVEDVYELVAAQ